MKVICLIENTQGREDVLAEHGLCLYIETEKHRILADTGASGGFIENAAKLGVKPEDVDTVVLSHGHYDHSGGILPFAEINPRARIFMQKSAAKGYYHIYPDCEKYIGIDEKILSLPQVRLMDGGFCIDDELEVFSGVKGRRLHPQGNRVLAFKTDSGFVEDDFRHEQYLVINENGYKVLVSGCAHNGILNILDRYRELYGSDPDAVISGFHMMKKDGYTAEDEAVIKETAEELLKTDIKFYTGHCTGEYPCQLLKELMGEQLTVIHSGDRIM
ncbi:MAG: MBL fold metallo-hydrolase [Oscillospiraceae bacterium]|nr:MBL fold metallo-hydrolase [Oscillospiraceae bacterium]